MPEPIQDTSVETLSPEQEQEQKDTILQDAESNPNIHIDDGEEETTETTAEPTEETTATEEPKTKVTWYEGLGPDIVNDPDVTKYKTLEEYIKGNREVRKMVGKDKLVVPTDKSTPEEVNDFYKKLGRPDEMTGYSFPSLDMPKEIQATEGELEAYRAKAFELGLTEKQFTELFDIQQQTHIARLNKELEKVQKLGAVTETTLRKEWGAAYDSKIDAAQKVINTFFKGQDLHSAFNVLANDTGFVRAMASIAENIGEDAIAGETRYTKTPVEAQKEWDSIVAGRHDLSKAYFDDLNPEHSVAVDRVLTLQRMAMAGGE